MTHNAIRKSMIGISRPHWCSLTGHFPIQTASVLEVESSPRRGTPARTGIDAALTFHSDGSFLRSVCKILELSTTLKIGIHDGDLQNKNHGNKVQATDCIPRLQVLASDR